MQDAQVTKSQERSQVMFKPACSATETSWNLKICLLQVTIVLGREQITKTLISVAAQAAQACNNIRFSRDEAHLIT